MCAIGILNGVLKMSQYKQNQMQQLRELRAKFNVKPPYTPKCRTFEFVYLKDWGLVRVK
jgi:hypothetical protein